MSIDRLPAELRRLARRESVPAWRDPTLATLTGERFSDPAWIFERKLDGVRCLAFRDGRSVRLLSRNRLAMNGTYPELVDALAAQGTRRFAVDGGDLVYAGTAGTGFDDKTLRTLRERLGAAERDTPPFTRGTVHEAGARWVDPVLVAEIGFSEWTRDGTLRQPRYLGLRTAKPADQVVRETR